LSVTATPEGARLRCTFQRLEGEVTRDGLWLRSTTGNAAGERLRVRAMAVGRSAGVHTGLDRTSERRRELNLDDAVGDADVLGAFGSVKPVWKPALLAPVGTVSIADQLVRCTRPGLTEEYSVSVDGVRQDFIVEQRPTGQGELRVELDLTGAKAEPLANGARLVLDGSGRKLAYARLRAVDAKGKDLTARLQVTAETRLAVLVEDGAATYPVCIDPTFSDEDWFCLGSGVNGSIKALAVSGSNLYVGGQFTSAGGNNATNVAKWDGSKWSALGSGVNGSVSALAVSGSDLYVAGAFTMAGGNNANYVAKWNGSAWLALGPGLGSVIPVERFALAVSGSNLYVGGPFTITLPNGASVSDVEKWNGSAWSDLGAEVNGQVCVLAMSGNDLYVGGTFTMPGGGTVGYVAEWNGSGWSALGSGVGSTINALAVSGSDLYVAGTSTLPGIGSAGYVAKWNGSEWPSFGWRLGGTVNALAVSGTDLYAGGNFSSMGGSSTNCVARWDGSAWSALGSGVGGLSNSYVSALAVSGSDLYVGGSFSTAGGKPSAYVARAYIGAAHGRFTDWVSSPVTGFSCTFSDGTIGKPYRIQTSPSLAGGSWTDLTNFTYAGPTVITDASAVSTTNTFYRAVTP
jgi:hypothetical protein